MADVNVIDSNGNPGTIDSAEFALAQSQGFRLATDQEVNSFAKSEKFGSPSQKVKTFLEGAGRGLSAGLSTPLEVQLGVNPQDIQGRKEENPVTSTAGEVAGVGAGLAIPGLDEVSGPALISKAGKAASEAASIPEASTMVGKVLSGAAKTAVGSAVEGAAYGTGDVISEKALGDPNLNAQSVISQIGLSAVLAGGLGGALGLVGEALPKAYKALKEPIFGTVSEEAPSILAAAEPVPSKIPSNFEEAIKFSAAPPEEKIGLLKGLQKMKPNAGEIKEAGDLLGVPVSPMQTSDSPELQRAGDALLRGPWANGRFLQEQAKAGFDKTESVVHGILGDSTDTSQAQLGKQLKESLLDKFTKVSEPIKEMYDYLHSNFREVPVNPEDINSVVSEVKSMRGFRISPSSPQAQIGKRVIRELPLLKTVEDVKEYATQLNKSLSAVASPEEKRIAGEISQKLSELQDKSVTTFAETKAKDLPSTDKIHQLIPQRQEANKAFKKMLSEWSPVGEQLGYPRFRGAQDFINFVEDLTPEKLGSKLFAKNDSEFLKFFNKQFPDEMTMLAQHERGQMMSARNAMKDGKLNVTQIIKNVFDNKKYSPELRDILFSPDELKQMKAVRTWREAWPADFNPSHTASQIERYNMLKNPISGAMSLALDKIGPKLMKLATPQEEGKVSALSGLERKANKTLNLVERGVKGIFSGAKEISGYTAAKASQYIVDKRSDNSVNTFQKRAKSISEYVNNIDHMSDKLNESTSGIADHAPMISSAMQQTMTRGVQFLSSKLPQTQDTGFLGKKIDPSKEEISTFNRYYDAVEKPLNVFDEIHTGILSQETVETLNEVYPDLLNHIKTEIVHGATKDEVTIPYSTRLQLGLLFGMDMDPGMSGQAILANQARLQAPSQQQEAKQSNTNKMQVSNRYLTSQQKTVSREA